MSKTLTRLRENLLLGLLSLAPAALTFWVLLSVLDSIDSMMARWLPLEVARIPGFGFLITVLLLLFVGSMARTVSGKFLNRWSDSILSRVPVVRGLYRVAKQMSSAFFSSDTSAAFKRVVLVPFPSPSARALAFVTGQHSPTESIVFVPTAPNPTGGYVLIFKNSEIEDSPMPVHEALKFVVSCGTTTGA